MAAKRTRNPWFKFYAADYFEATRCMTYEERGAYADIIVMQMMYEGNVPDDSKWMAHQMHVSTRKWEAVRSKLIAREKIKSEGGLIIQERCLKELDELISKRQHTSDAAKKREQSKRGPAPAQLRPSDESALTQSSLIDENSEKHNDFNGGNSKIVALRARVLDSDTDRERKNPPLAPPGGGDTHGGFGRAAAAVAVGIMAATTPLAANPIHAGNQATLFAERVAPEAQPAAKATRRARGARTLLPEDWALPMEWRNETKAKFGATDQQIDRQAERFKRWWLSPDSKNRLKVDWKTTWLNWIDSAQSRGSLGASGASNGNGQHYRSKQSNDEIWLDRELAKARQDGLLV